jgi:hypothetical protein
MSSTILPPPHANSFVLGPAVIKHAHLTHSAEVALGGSPTSEMLVEMLVEKVFLVSGVGKNLKKN